MTLKLISYNFLLAMVFLSLQACNSKQETKANVSNPEENLDEVEEKNDENQKFILFFGNSLTAGYGLKEEESFPSLIQNKLNQSYPQYRVINAGLSGETTADGANRIDWILKQQIDLFVLELGANDMLRGININETEKNLKQIINQVKSKYPNIPIVIAGMKAAPNMGQDYISEFDSVFGKLAKEYKTGLIPFLLEGVAGNPQLNLKDGKHPNAKGQKIVAENVWKVLKQYL